MVVAIAIGIVTASAAPIARLGYQVMFNHMGNQAEYSWKISTVLAQISVSFCAYWLALALSLFLQYLNREKAYAVQNQFVLASARQSVASLKHLFALLSVPYLLYFLSTLLTPDFYSHLFTLPAIWIAFLPHTIWFGANLLIVRYWTPLSSSCFYLAFIIIPGVATFIMLSALVTIIRIHSANQL